MGKTKLTLKQERFVNNYVRTGNLYQSAVDAGYSHNYARAQSYKLRNREEISLAIDNKMRELKSKAKIEGNIQINPKLSNKLLKWAGSRVEVKKLIERLVLDYLPSEDITEEEWVDNNKRNPIPNKTRYYVMSRAGFKCQACGSKPSKSNDVVLHIDHIVPFTKGGSDSPNNLQVLCEKCNISKGNRYKINHNINWDDEENIQLKMIK